MSRPESPPQTAPRLVLLRDRPERLDELASALHAEWGAFAPWASLETVRARFARQLGEHPPFTLLLLSVHDELLGTASVKCHELDGHHDKPFWLGEVWVAPAWRGSGYGRELVVACIERARQLGLAALYLYTPDQQPWYRRLGWRETERIVQDGETVSIMRLELVPR